MRLILSVPDGVKTGFDNIARRNEMTRGDLLDSLMSMYLQLIEGSTIREAAILARAGFSRQAMVVKGRSMAGRQETVL